MAFSSILISSLEFFVQVAFGLLATHTELKFETKPPENRFAYDERHPGVSLLKQSPKAVPSVLLMLSHHPFEL